MVLVDLVFLVHQLHHLVLVHLEIPVNQAVITNKGMLYRGSYMSAYVLLSLLNELEKEIKCEACRAFYLFFATSLINSIIQEHEC